MDSSSFDVIQSNRAASRKFLSQLLQSSRGFSVPSELQSPQGPMLHRSPSGAKRKIRQQREKGDVTTPLSQTPPTRSDHHQQPSSSSSSSPPTQSIISSPPTVSSHPPPSTVSYNTPSMDAYRRVIDDGGYQSILPEMTTSYTPSPPQPPVPAPRMHLPSSFSSSLSHLDRIGSPSIRLESSFSSSSSSSSSPCPSIDSRSSPTIESLLRTTVTAVPKAFPVITPAIPPSPIGPPTTAKPTVEVHPMPTERKKEKPVVPAKPKGLKLMDPLTPTSLSPSPIMNRWNSTNSLYTPPLSASPLSTSSMFINQLFSTPSFANLTASYEKAAEFDDAEREDLENRRMESLVSLSTRISRLQDELTTIQKEMAVNDEIGQGILEFIEGRDANVYDKVRRQLESEKELLMLETKLRLQLDKCTKHIREELTLKKAEAVMEENRIRGKLNETRLLRSIYANRERDIERSITSLLRDEDARRWHNYKDGFCKMIEEAKEIEMQLDDAKMQLRYLHTTKPSY